MHTKTYTRSIGFFLLVLLIFLGTPKLSAQTFDLRFQTEVDCNQNELATTIQIRMRNDSFRIGELPLFFLIMMSRFLLSLPMNPSLLMKMMW